MSHEELLAKIHKEDSSVALFVGARTSLADALRAVVELHKPWQDTWPTSGNLRLRCGSPDCTDGFTDYPCSTIQAIEAELNR